MTAAAAERWAVIDRLTQGVVPIPWSCRPPRSRTSGLARMPRLHHVELGPRRVRLLRLGHVGADLGRVSSARFAHAAIARIGQVIALAVGEMVRALFEAVLPCRAWASTSRSSSVRRRSRSPTTPSWSRTQRDLADAPVKIRRLRRRARYRAPTISGCRGLGLGR